MNKNKIIEIAVFSGVAIISGVLIRKAKQRENFEKTFLIRDRDFRLEILLLQQNLDYITSDKQQKIQEVLEELKLIIGRYIEYTEGSAEYINNILYTHEQKINKLSRYTDKMVELRKTFNHILN